MLKALALRDYPTSRTLGHQQHASSHTITPAGTCLISGLLLYLGSDLATFWPRRLLTSVPLTCDPDLHFIFFNGVNAAGFHVPVVHCRETISTISFTVLAFKEIDVKLLNMKFFVDIAHFD